MASEKQGIQDRSIAYKLVMFSLPLILSGILQQLYNWVDAFIVGNVEGDLSLAAIGAVSSVVNIFCWLLPASLWVFLSFLRRNMVAGYLKIYPHTIFVFCRFWCDIFGACHCWHWTGWTASAAHADTGRFVSTGGGLFADRICGCALFGGL